MCVAIGEENGFNRESSASILRETETVLITRDDEGKVSVYELCGKPWAGSSGARVRTHRHYSLLHPDMRRLEGGFKERICEVLLSQDVSYGLLERIFALQILRLPLAISRHVCSSLGSSPRINRLTCWPTTFLYATSKSGVTTIDAHKDNGCPSGLVLYSEEND